MYLHLTYSCRRPPYCAIIDHHRNHRHPSVMFDSSGIAIATVHSILVVADIVGNCLVCAIIKKYRDMRYVDTKITLSVKLNPLFSSAVNLFMYALVNKTFHEKLKGMIRCRLTGFTGSTR